MAARRSVKATKATKAVKAVKAVSPKASKPILTTVFKKKRNTEPGIRHQGGRIYDSENGTSCHQCRQKTLEVKAACTSPQCSLHWCPRCLSNRYNEEVDAVRLLKKWDCPKCRKVCNCSNCRKKQGLQATGILANIAKSAGFGSVSQLLEKNPRMSVLSAGPTLDRGSKENSKLKSRVGGKRKLDENRTSPYGGLDDAALKKRTHPMPAPAPPRIHLDEERLEIPASLDTSTFICVLEFFATFGGTIDLRDGSISSLAQQLLSSGGSPQASQLVDALVALKGVVCNWFGADQVDPDGLAWDSWIVSRYSLGAVRDRAGVEEIDARSSRPMRASKASKRSKDVSASASDHPSPLGRRVQVLWPVENAWFTGVVRQVDGKGKMLVAYDDGDETWEKMDGTNSWKFVDRMSGPSFWSLSVADRLQVVNLVVHDSLQCGPIVDVIENSIEDASEGRALHKREIERVKKEISAEKERHKQRFIAELISSQQISNISAEKQQEILTSARQNASSSVSKENTSRLRWLKTSEFFKNCTGRTAPVGQDRTGLSYFSLNCAEIVTGSSNGLICMSEDSICCFRDEDIRRVITALDVSGEKEGALRMGLESLSSYNHS